MSSVTPTMFMSEVISHLLYNEYIEVIPEPQQLMHHAGLSVAEPFCTQLSYCNLLFDLWNSTRPVGCLIFNFLQLGGRISPWQ